MKRTVNNSGHRNMITYCIQKWIHPKDDLITLLAVSIFDLVITFHTPHRDVNFDCEMQTNRVKRFWTSHDLTWIFEILKNVLYIHIYTHIFLFRYFLLTFFLFSPIYKYFIWPFIIDVVNRYKSDVLWSTIFIVGGIFFTVVNSL